MYIKRTRLALQQVLRLVCSDMRDGGKYVRTVCCGSFDTVSMIDTSFTRFVIDVKVLQVVVEVNGAGTQVSTEKRRVRSEDRSHVDVALAAAFIRKGKGYVLGWFSGVEEGEQRTEEWPVQRAIRGSELR
jgi:DNA-binding beta-propeller fold protein YncE